MRFTLDGLDVFFPYDYLYKEQYDYMLHLKKALDERGHFLLEMPTGTGKTVCLIALISSYQLQNPKTGKLIYCTRTVPEMFKCMEEIKKVIAYRSKILGVAKGGNILALCLSSRRNMCLNSRVMEEGDREAVDSLCRNMTASWVRSKAYGVRKGEKITSDHQSTLSYPIGDTNTIAMPGGFQLCEFYENYDREGSTAEIPKGVYSLDDLKSLGKNKKWCPYFMTRHFIHHANILVYNYQYILDPRVSNIISQELENESIVVFDEAHNIDNVCIEALSVILDKKMIESSLRNISTLQRKVTEMKASDTSKLTKEYHDLLKGLTDVQQQQRRQHQQIHGQTINDTSVPVASSTSSSAAVAQSRQQSSSSWSLSSANNHSQALSTIADAFPALPLPSLPQDLLDEAIPGNIRKAEHFLIYLKKLIIYLKTLFLNSKDVENHTPLAFLHLLQQATGLERKPLRYTHTRLNSLMRTLEITALDEFLALTSISNFISLISTYLEGFAVIIEPSGSVISGIVEPLMHLTCLDASIAIKPVFDRFVSVIITSGTLSPIDFYPKLLNFKPILRVSLPMSTFRPCLLPLIITRGNDQIAISTKFELRKDIAVIRNYGHLLLECVSNIPDGICVFFTSYLYMEYIISIWDKMNILNQIMEYKLIYLETKDVVETTLALENYRRACDCGRGAVFLSVARGKVAEGIDFDRHYGRCVLLFGIPYQYTLSHVLKARLNFMREKYNIKENDFLTFDALRQSAQCIGRVIRSKTDYGIVILADIRYNRNEKKSKFPPWILQFLKETGLNLSTDIAMSQIKTFLKQVGQPIEEESLKSILLNEVQIKKLNDNQQFSSIATGGIILHTPKTFQQQLKEEHDKEKQKTEENESGGDNDLVGMEIDDDLFKDDIAEEGNEEDWNALREMEEKEKEKDKEKEKEKEKEKRSSFTLPSPLPIEKLRNKYNSLFLFTDDE